MPGDCPLTPFRVTLAMVLVMVTVLLIAGCSTTSESDKKTALIPQDRYIFFENHIKTDGVTITGECSPWGSIDFPMYQFDEKNGILTVSVSSDTTIDDSLKMFYGDGENLAGVAGDGARTWASPVYSLPYTKDNVTLESISSDGTVTLRYNEKSLILKPKERWENITRGTKMPAEGKNCTAEFNTTDSLYNAGFLNKGTIVIRILSES